MTADRLTEVYRQLVTGGAEDFLDYARRQQSPDRETVFIMVSVLVGLAAKLSQHTMDADAFADGCRKSFEIFTRAEPLQ